MMETYEDMKAALLAGHEIVLSAEIWSGLLIDSIAELTGIGEGREFTFRLSKEDSRVAIGLKPR